MLERDGRHARARHARQRRRPGEGHGRGVRPRDRGHPGGAGRGPDPEVHGQRLRAAACEGRLRGLRRVVRRRRPARPRRTRSSSGQSPEKGGIIWTDNMLIPTRRERADGVDVHELRTTTRRSRPRSRSARATSRPSRGSRRSARRSNPTPLRTSSSSRRDEMLAQLYAERPGDGLERRLHHDVAGGSRALK